MGSYGPVLVKGVIIKRDDVWENAVTEMLPLYKSDSYVPKRKLDYSDVVLFEELITLDSLIEIVKELPEKGVSNVTLCNYDVKIEVSNLSNGHQYDSGDESYDVGWFCEKYLYQSNWKGYGPSPTGEAGSGTAKVLA